MWRKRKKESTKYGKVDIKEEEGRKIWANWMDFFLKREKFHEKERGEGMRFAERARTKKKILYYYEGWVECFKFIGRVRRK